MPVTKAIPLESRSTTLHMVTLDVAFDDIQALIQTNIEEGFPFLNNVILAFQKNVGDETGKRGALILTSATPSIRGSALMSAFAAGNHVLRSLSQSLVKEFGKRNIHVSHAIIDGSILVALVRKNHHDPEWGYNEDARLSPKGVTESSLHFVNQPCSTSRWGQSMAGGVIMDWCHVVLV
ncbi:hypothetical protein EDD85DRAFT_542188 [Armillaria nabsnona]|nr:hypothetical protein EDD85DRAFT_542188 [Armillaria nabsnona]